MEPSQEPSFLSLMMMGSSSSLPLFILPHTAPPAPPKSKRDWKNDSTALFEEKFLANNMNSLTQQQWHFEMQNAHLSLWAFCFCMEGNGRSMLMPDFGANGGAL
jgi:hypothetical protein